MNTFSLKEAVEQSLWLLEQNGASAKTVKGYLNTGFGAAICHFAGKGITEVSAKMLDSFVLEQRTQFECGQFSVWKWQLIRRGSELLKEYIQTGTIKFTALRSWEPVLRKPRQSVELDTPTPEQLADPEDLFALIWRTKKALLDEGLTAQTVRIIQPRE